MRPDSFKPRIPGVLLFLLIFQNLFNTGSPFITLALNLCVATALLMRSAGRCRIPDGIIVLASYAVLVWLLLVILYRGGVEGQILLKYLRVPVNLTLMTVMFGSGTAEPRSVATAINVSLGFHLLLIALQIVFPDVTHFTAVVFGFARELAILDQFALRKLGASSSYDTASLFSVFALVFFYLQFHRRHRKSLLVMTALAFAASLMSSRTGIALASSIVVLIVINELRRASMFWKCAAVFGAAGFLFFAYAYIYPILLHTLGIVELDPGRAGLFVASSDYGTTGTLDALTGEHLRPLDRPLEDLLIGFGVDPNNVSQITDIGYVKMIYHVGIVGAVLIMLTHMYMFLRLRQMARWTGRGTDLDMIRRFLLCVIVIAVVINYKSLELYSRGVGDFIFMLFLFMASHTSASSAGRSRPSSRVAA